jgi:hypothetical protein
LRYWRDPDYWRWRWGRVGEGARFGLVLLLAGLIGLGGYYTAVVAGSGGTTAAYRPPTQSVVTVQRTVIHPIEGKTRVMTELRTVSVPSLGGAQVVTVPGTGQTVIEQVTVNPPGRVHVVTNAQTRTMLESTTVERPVNVTTVVSGPTRTVTNQVTSPGRTVTGPTHTVTTTVTQPPRTITETTTNTVTTTQTVTTTETVTCKKPC